MEIGITIPLQKFLKLKQLPCGTCPDPLFCWDVHRVKIANGKVLMIVSNASSYFAAVTRMTAATWKRWEGEAAGAIADSMAVSGFDEATIRAYFDAAGVEASESLYRPTEGVEVTKTHGRVSVGHMNQSVDMIWFENVDSQCSVQSDMCYLLNNKLIRNCSLRKSYIFPAEAFAESLAEHGILRGKVTLN